MKVAPGDENQAADVVSGVYEKHRKLRAGDIVLDIGAHVGYFTMTAAQKVGPIGKVFSFEPHPDNFLRLDENCRDLPNVTLFWAAAWDYNGLKPMYTMGNNSGGHSLFEFEGYVGVIHVRVIDIGQLLSDLKLIPTFVKIDAENSEYAIVKSILSRCEPGYFGMEMHTKELHRLCTELFYFHGYECTPKEHTSYHFYAWKP